MHYQISRMSFAAIALAASFGVATLAHAQSAPPSGNTGKFEWPSRSLPEQPIQVRACSCRYAGQNIPIGETICMRFEGKQVFATCETVVNNPSWNITSKICPST